MPQGGQVASPNSVGGSIVIALRQIGQWFGLPSGVLDETDMAQLRGSSLSYDMAKFPGKLEVDFFITNRAHFDRCAESLL